MEMKMPSKSHERKRRSRALRTVTLAELMREAVKVEDLKNLGEVMMTTTEDELNSLATKEIDQ